MMSNGRNFQIGADAVIPLQKVEWAKLKKGNHQLKIMVPDAKFENKEGTIPFSAYLLGR